jgi:hypothetical protein
MTDPITSPQMQSPPRNGTTTVVLFHFFEADECYRDNLVFFLSCACNSSVDLILILSGDCSVPLPDWPNLRVVRTENINHDYGGYCSVLRNSRLEDSYDHIIFVNSSTRGPFLAGGDTGGWHRRFTDKLNADTHLVGTSVNFLPEETEKARLFRSLYHLEGGCAHIQTTAYALTATALRHLREIGFYDCCTALPKEEVIVRYEIRLTREIASQNWSVHCLLPRYACCDIAKGIDDPNFSACNGDPLFPGAYFGGTVKAAEIMFLKTNRRLLDEFRLGLLTVRQLLSAKDKRLCSWKPYRLLLRRQAVSLLSKVWFMRIEIPLVTNSPTLKRVWARGKSAFVG